MPLPNKTADVTAVATILRASFFMAFTPLRVFWGGGCGAFYPFHGNPPPICDTDFSAVRELPPWCRMRGATATPTTEFAG
jgi:hypothetical protein